MTSNKGESKTERGGDLVQAERMPTSQLSKISNGVKGDHFSAVQRTQKIPDISNQGVVVVDRRTSGQEHLERNDLLCRRQCEADATVDDPVL